MGTFQARLVDPPVQVVQGTFVLGDVAASATSVPVKQAGHFNDGDDGGGWLRLRLSASDVDSPPADLVVQYVTWDGDDEDVEYVVLAAAPGVAIPDGTPVDVWDPVKGRPSLVYRASVMPDDAPTGSEPLTVIVDPDLMDALTPEMLPGPGDSVLIEEDEEDDDARTLVRLLGGELTRSLAYVDVDTAPPGLGGDSGPTEPPASSPAPVVRPVPVGVEVRFDPSPDAVEATTYRVYVSASNSAAPGPSSLLSSGASSPVVVTKMPNGDPLPDASSPVAQPLVYVALVASNGPRPETGVVMDAPASAWVGSTAGTPEPAATTLAAPTSTPYLAGRTPASAVGLSWSAVTVDQNGAPISGVRYEIEERAGTGSWRLRTTVSGGTSVNVSPYVPATLMGFRVRAVAAGESGPWSPEQTVTTAVDTVPPPKPSKPTATSRLGTARFGWGGFAATGAPMGADFDRVEVHVSKTAGFTPTQGDPTTLLGALTTAGDLVLARADYTTYYVRLLARNLWGNWSEPSDPETVIVAPLVDVSNFPDDAMEDLYARTGHFIVLTADQLLANNAFVDALEAGNILAEAIDVTDLSGKRITGALVRTAATGQRWELGRADMGTTNQLLAYSGSPVESEPGGLSVGVGTSGGALLTLLAPRLGSNALLGIEFLSGGRINLLGTLLGGNAGTGAFFTDLRDRILAAAPAPGLNQSQVDQRVQTIAPTVTMTSGAVGTGAFRDSVDARVSAAAPTVTMTTGNAGTGGFWTDLRDRVLAAVKTAIDTVGSPLRTSVIAAARDDTGWINLTTFSNGASANVNTPPQYRIFNGAIFLRGIINRSGMAAGTPYVVATIPAVARPDQNTRFIVSAGAVYGSLLVGADGSLEITPSASAANVHINVTYR